jgi:hypothetical protein
LADDHPLPPNQANVLDPATWQLELMVCGDNIRAERCFITIDFDGTWPDNADDEIWEHILVRGPSREPATRPP